MTAGAVTVSAEALSEFATAILIAADVPAERARAWVDVLVWANLRGMDSHGVLRIPRYIAAMKGGEIKAHGEVRLEKRSGAIAILDSDWAPGPVAMNRAVDEAIGRAGECHVGWCVARNITHAGAIGYFALAAARRGYAAMVMTASRPMMAYHGAKVPGASTNPLAIAAPGGAHPPLLLDMSTATVSLGKVLAARDSGTPIPDGWGIDADGKMTNDADKVATLLPLGGAKGSGLSMMMECLLSLSVGNPLIAPNIQPGVTPTGYRQNGLAVAIDIAAFTDPDRYRRDVDELAASLKALPRAEGVDEIFAPGEHGDAIMAERLARGIPLPAGTWERLATEADALGVAMPAT